MTVWPKEFSAVTVIVPACPAVTEVEKPVTRNSVTTVAGKLTTMPVCEPVMLLETVSVAVSDCVPTVLNVALNVPTPLVNVACPGSTARESLLVNATIPV